MRRCIALFTALPIVAFACLVQNAQPAVAADEGPEYREIHFPVEGAVSFSDDFGDPRSGGRTHEGNDLMGKKMQRLLAATDGTVTMAKLDASGLSGNMLTIKDADGWSYRYIHVNNDTPGTDDGLNLPQFVLAPGIERGHRVPRLALEPPPLRPADRTSQRVRDGVEVGADVQPVQHEVVTGVDDGRHRRGVGDGDDPAQHPRRTHAAGQDRDRHRA